MAADPTGRISHLPDMHRGQSWKLAVRCATTANGTLASSFENGDSIDGVTLATGDRILIKNQTTGSENGIYIVQASGAPVRAFDMDQDGTTDVVATEVYGAVIWVVQGTTNAGTLWYCTNTGTITLGTTALTFSQFSGGAGASFATPSIALGSSAAAGAASTVIRSDSTIAAFDATAPVTQALGDSAATGSAAFAARRDHKHGMPALSTATPIVASGSGSVGTGTLSSREDHVHPTGAGSGTLTTVEEVDGSPTDSAVTKLVFPNGTLSIVSHVATYTPTAAGSSRPYLDLAVALDGTYGDDFAAASLDAKWTHKNISGGETFQSGDGSWLRTVLASATSAQFYYQNAPAGDWEIMWAGIREPITAIQMMVGPLVIDSTGAGRAVCWYTDGNVYEMLLTAYTYASTGPTVTRNVALDGVKHWLALKKSGTSYTARFSLDGINWSEYSAGSTWTGTVDKIGFGRFWTNSGATCMFATDIFNKIA